VKIKFLGAFAKFREATISFVMSVRLFAWNNSATNWTELHEILCLSIFLMYVEQKSVFIKIGQE